MRRAIVSITLALALLGAGSLLPTASASDDACDWPMYGHDLGHSFSNDQCTTLTPLTAPSIAPLWGLNTPDSLTASPTVVDGVAYAGDWTGAFYAIPVDQTGYAKPSWTYQIDDRSAVAFGRIVSSASVTEVADTQVVIFGGGATLYVLEADTEDPAGHKLAALCLDPRATNRCSGDDQQVEIEASPAVVHNEDGSLQIIIGMDVHNSRTTGRTGVVSSTLRHDAGRWTLVPDWKFDPEGTATTDADGVTYAGPGLLTAGIDTGYGCASVWGSPAVDVVNGLVFFGTGSCGTSGIDVGEDAWAVRLEDGGQVWRYNTPRVSEHWDDDYGASPNLLPDGLVGFGSKDGSYYALNGMSGVLAQRTRVGQAGHLTTGFAVGGIIGTPAVGKVSGRDAVFATTALSTPLDEPLDEGHPDKWADTSLAADPFRMLSVTAFDPVDGTILWRSPLSRQSYGAPSFANGVLLVPSTFSAQLLAFHADTGALLSVMPVVGASSSSPTVVGDTIYLGAGTRTSDLEYKAFGTDALDALIGASPLSPASGLFAYRMLAPDLHEVPSGPPLPAAPFGPR